MTAPSRTHRHRTMAVAIATALAALALAGCSSGAASTPTGPGTATATAPAGPPVLPVTSNPITNTSTVQALKIVSVMVENNVDPATRAIAPDHLVIRTQ